jgi:hypothetical protein
MCDLDASGHALPGHEGRRNRVLELCCFENNHWSRYAPVVRYYTLHLADDLQDLGVSRECGAVYMIRFVNIRDPREPLIFKYVGSCSCVARRMLQHLSAVWTGNSRHNGSLLMTSTGHRLVQLFDGDLSFFRVEILKKGIAPSNLFEEERQSMLAERAFAMYGQGGLNVVDPISYLYFLNGGVSLRHLQRYRFDETWTCVDFVNNVILPITRERRVSYHEFLEASGDATLHDAYRVVPDFFVAPTCNNCLWKDVLSYLQSKSTVSKEIKEGDKRPKYLHDAGDLYVFLSFLAINLHKERRPWPFAAS